MAAHSQQLAGMLNANTTTACSFVSYLMKCKRRSILFHSLGAIVALSTGAIVLFFTFWIGYAVIWAGTLSMSAIAELIVNKRLQLSHKARIIGSGIFIILLFVQNSCTNRWYWGNYPRRKYPFMPVLQYQAGAAGGFVWLLAHPGASANMITDLLLTAPRLFAGAWQMISTASRMSRLDAVSCAALLSFLLERGRAVPYKELHAAGWEPLLGQLHCIEGVCFLEKGISLSEELRKELTTVRGNKM